VKPLTTAFLEKWVKQCRHEISRANLLRSFDGMQLRQALEIRPPAIIESRISMRS
jgi:hypothetical protein